MSSGIHHVTAIAGDPQRNLDFYAGIFGATAGQENGQF